ncbi:tubby C-terminal-like domain-containing protein [Pterulicium gracile]|uniref:Tubby C-terminal-like domain-containing protein n=1 Tax=Pterulicium gracile TaxID=1884261 RepID=A0A5C3Q7V1_9AGAR|nr:tubby C-terminal-like domain-containing protein [Pterula gracilis]
MGLFSSSSTTDVARQPPPPLQRVSQAPIGVNQAFSVHNQPVTLKLQEKQRSLTGDSFYIKDAASDQPVLECKAKSFSLHARKEFVDLQGRTLFHLKKKILALHATFEGVSPDDETVLFTVKKSFSFGKVKLNATFRNAADGQEISLALRGDFFDRAVRISPEGPVVGRISRDFFNAREIFSRGAQTYFLTIAPGVDVAMLAAICVILDQIYQENSVHGQNQGARSSPLATRSAISVGE